MKPSSSTSDRETAPAGLFDGVLARGRVRDAVADSAWLRAMLQFEAALARAEARTGLIAVEEADAISAACQAVRLDPAELGEAAADSGNPVVPLVRVLRSVVEGGAADRVHWGATSQDVIDSAAMLVAREAIGAILDDLSGASEAAASLAASHRATVMAGRTILQQAVPITFGLVAAGWLGTLDDAMVRLEWIRDSRLAVQFGGAAGTLAPLGPHGVAVLGHLARELDLAEPPMPWHTNRTIVGEIAGALAVAAGAIGKCALDVVLLAQTEVGEVHEGVAGRGGSSTLPQKRNPIAAVSAIACARQAPGLAATLLGAMSQELERGAGGWHAEWQPLNALLVATGSAAAWLRDCLEHLEVDESRMATNLEVTGGLLMAERITETLEPHLGRAAARDLVERACADAVARGRRLDEILATTPELPDELRAAGLAGLFEPETYLGSADSFVARALEAHAGQRRASGDREPAGAARR